MSDFVETPRPCTTREAVAVTFGLIAVMGLQLVAANAFSLFSKYFWVDEFLTYAVVSDPDLGHALQAIHGGIDTVPTYSLLLRFLRLLVPGPAETLLRGASLASIVLALVGIYVLLRRSVRSLAAVTAVFVVWAHPLVLGRAFDARFHGPFLTCAVWFCYWVDRRLREPDRHGAAVGLALSSVALCAIHVYGVVAWAIVLTGAAIAGRRIRLFWPGAVGLLAVPVLWAGALQPHRLAVTIPTWEAPFTWSRAAGMAQFVLLPGHLATVFLLVFGVMCAHAVVARTPLPAGPGLPAPALVLLSTLSVLVPAIVVVSLVIQPTLTPRYVVPAIAALAPAVAFALTRLPRWGMAVILAVLVGYSTLGLRREANQARWMDQQTNGVIAALRQLPADRPVVFEVTHVLQVVWHYAPDLRSRLVLLDFETGDVPNPGPIRIVSRDLARTYGRYYEGPRVISWAQLRLADEFLLAPDARAYAPPPTAATRYSGFTVTPLTPLVSRVTADR